MGTQGKHIAPTTLVRTFTIGRGLLRRGDSYFFDHKKQKECGHDQLAITALGVECQRCHAEWKQPLNGSR